MRTCLVFVISLLAAQATAQQVPKRLVAVTGDPVPAQTDRATTMVQIDQARVGPTGAVTFRIDSSRNQSFPNQHALDLRGATDVAEADAVLMPIFGVDVVRDADIDGFVADPKNVDPLDFEPDGSLVIPAAVVPPGAVGNADGWVVRHPDGTYEIAAFESTAEATSDYSGVLDVLVAPDDRLLIFDSLGAYWAGSPRQKIFEAADPAPWDPNDLPVGLLTPTILDSGDVVLCCAEDAPVLVNANGTLSLTDPTPPNALMVDELKTWAVHHSGLGIYTDRVDDMDGNPLTGLFAGPVGTRADYFGPITTEEPCATPVNLTSSLYATSTGPVFFHGCVGSIGNPIIRWLGPGDDIAGDVADTLQSIDLLDFFVSDDGGALAFMGTATSSSGPIQGIFLVEQTGANATIELVAYVGEELEVRGRTAAITGLFLSGVNNLGHAVFSAALGPNPDTGLTDYAIFVTNQEGTPEDRAADLDAVSGQYSFDGLLLRADVQVANHGPTADLLDATVVLPRVPFGLDPVSPACEAEDEPDAIDPERPTRTVTCEFVSLDDQSLIPLDELIPLSIELEITEEFRLSSLSEVYTAEINSSLSDPDTSNNATMLTVAPDINENARLDIQATEADGVVTFVVGVENLGDDGDPLDLSVELFEERGGVRFNAESPAECSTSNEKDSVISTCTGLDVPSLSTRTFTFTLDTLNFGFDVVLENLNEGLLLDTASGGFDFGALSDDPDADPRVDAPDKDSSCATTTSGPAAWPVLAFFVIVLVRRRRPRRN